MKASAPLAKIRAASFYGGEPKMLLLPITRKFPLAGGCPDDYVRHRTLLTLRQNPGANAEAELVTTKQLSISMNVDLTRDGGIIGVGERLTGHNMERLLAQSRGRFLLEQPARIPQRSDHFC